MGNTFFFGWEIALMETLQRVMPSWLMTVVSQLSVFGEEIALILILGLFYWGLDKKAGKYIGEIAIIGVLWNPMIKNVFCRRRPFMDNENIDLYRLIAPGADKYDVAAQGFSFPSGHSTNAASVYGGLARLKDSTAARVAAALIMLAVGFSRVAVGAHFPTDVICGWALGLFVVFFLPWFKKKLQNENLFYGILIATALPGLLYCRSEDYFAALGLLVGFVLAVKFEERFVNFENTRKPLEITLRLLGGGVIYVLCNTVLKRVLPAGEITRTVRYAVVVFLLLGVYPMAFKALKRR